MDAPPPPADVVEKKEKKHKKHRHKEPKEEQGATALITEDEAAKSKAKVQEDTADAQKPAPTAQLPVIEAIAPIAKPAAPKEKARTRDQLKNSTMIVEEMADGETFLRDYASDEVLLHIFSYMDPRTLGRCSQVCKRWHDVTEDRLLWIRHNRKEWLKSKDQSGAAAGKAFFLQRMSSFRRKKTAAEQNRRRILEDAQARERRRQAGLYHVYVLETSYVDAIMTVLFVLFLAFVSIKLDRLVDWHWHTVGIPLFIVVLLFVVRFIHIIFYAEDMNEANPSTDYFSMVSKFFVRLMESHLSPPDTGTMLLQLGCLVAFVILLFLHLDDVGQIKMSQVFAPIWIGYVISLGFLFGSFAEGDYIFGIMTGLLPYMIYFVLIALKLDRVIFVSWAVVHAPLWAGVPLWVISMFIWSVFIDEFNSAAEGLFWVGLFSYLAVGIPVFLVFQIIMVVKLDKGPLWDAKWRALFSPLFILFGLIAFISVSWALCVSASILDLIC